MSWFDALAKLTGRPSRGGRSSEARNNSISDMDGLSQAKAVLALEQAELAKQVEELISAYNEKVESLAWRLRTLPADVSAAELADIREAQRGLKSVLHRLEAAVKSRQELESEIVRWQGRSAGGTQDREEARRRSEIIRSELMLRGETDGIPLTFQTVGVDFRPVAKCGPVISKTPDESADLSDQGIEALPRMDEAQLVEAIRAATREAERWHAVPEEDWNEEALSQVHLVRELHALLKRLDKQKGVERDRIEIAINPRDMKE